MKGRIVPIIADESFPISVWIRCHHCNDPVRMMRSSEMERAYIVGGCKRCGWVSILSDQDEIIDAPAVARDEELVSTLIDMMKEKRT